MSVIPSVVLTPFDSERLTPRPCRVRTDSTVCFPAFSRTPPDLLRQSQEAGEAGDVDVSMALAAQAQEVQLQHDRLHKALTAPERTMEVCEICGIFMNSTDNEARRQVGAGRGASSGVGSGARVDGVVGGVWWNGVGGPGKGRVAAAWGRLRAVLSLCHPRHHDTTCYVLSFLSKPIPVARPYALCQDNYPLSVSRSPTTVTPTTLCHLLLLRST